MNVPVFLHGLATGALGLAAIVAAFSDMPLLAVYFAAVAGAMLVNGVANLRATS